MSRISLPSSSSKQCLGYNQTPGYNHLYVALKELEIWVFDPRADSYFSTRVSYYVNSYCGRCPYQHPACLRARLDQDLTLKGRSPRKHRQLPGKFYPKDVSSRAASKMTITWPKDFTPQKKVKIPEYPGNSPGNPTRRMSVCTLPVCKMAACESAAVQACRSRKGTNGVSTNVVTANFMFFDRGTSWVLLLTYLNLPRSARAYLLPQSVKIHYFCSGTISLEPICLQPKVAGPPVLVLVGVLLELFLGPLLS